MDNKYHDPVLLGEVIEHLKVKNGKRYIDATLGDGGHTIEILKLGGSVLGFDVSLEGLKRATKRITDLGLEKNFIGVCGNFKDIDTLAKENGFNTVDGVLYDLGYSSYELDEGNFGLSFMRDEPLDMRLDKTLLVTAADLVNKLPEQQLGDMLFGFSGEKFSRKIAKAIVEARELKRIQTTKDLSEIISREVSSGNERGRINPATRTFQALRIAVNDEIGNLERSLPRAACLLLPGSVIEVISFHSLEDKVTKQFGRGTRPSLIEVTRKPIVPNDEEVRTNPRSRSAKLRVFEKPNEE